MNLEKEIKDRLNYFYKRVDGTMTFPNSAEGDILKLVYKYIYEKEVKVCSCGKGCEGK